MKHNSTIYAVERDGVNIVAWMQDEQSDPQWWAVIATSLDEARAWREPWEVIRHLKSVEKTTTNEMLALIDAIAEAPFYMEDAKKELTLAALPHGRKKVTGGEMALHGWIQRRHRIFDGQRRRHYERIFTSDRVAALAQRCLDIHGWQSDLSSPSTSIPTNA